MGRYEGIVNFPSLECSNKEDLEIVLRFLESEGLGKPLLDNGSVIVKDSGPSTLFKSTVGIKSIRSFEKELKGFSSILGLKVIKYLTTDPSFRVAKSRAYILVDIGGG